VRKQNCKKKSKQQKAININKLIANLTQILDILIGGGYFDRILAFGYKESHLCNIRFIAKNKVSFLLFYI